ncbi:MAG: type II secretion system protein [Desulfuromonadales bacterium]
MITSNIKKKGFTLVELLMIVAILSALVAIALPTLNMYRVKAFNATAASDLRIFKVQLEASHIDNQCYPAGS